MDDQIRAAEQADLLLLDKLEDAADKRFAEWGIDLSSVSFDSIVFILALLLFLTAESGGTPRRMALIGADRPHMITALDGFVHGTRNYLVVTAVFGLIVAVLDS